MTQPGFDFADPVRPRKRGRVERTSVDAYLERPRHGRTACVVSWLRDEVWPVTSAELADMMGAGAATMETLLYVRRGLSDAQKLGLVSHAGERKCAVSGRVCLTWRVVTR